MDSVPEDFSNVLIRIHLGIIAKRLRFSTELLNPHTCTSTHIHTVPAFSSYLQTWYLTLSSEMSPKLVGPDVIFSARLESILQGKDSEVTWKPDLHFHKLKLEPPNHSGS